MVDVHSVFALANTDWHDLCQSVHDQAGANFQPLMTTDSNQLMRQGVETGFATFRGFISESGWAVADIDRTVCHQVGSAHRKLMLDSLQLSADRDFVTFPWLGNTGSAALPVSLAVATQEGILKRGEKIALLGIGSGINCVMIGCNWQTNVASGATWNDAQARIAHKTGT